MKRFIVTNHQDYEAMLFGCAYKALIVETVRRSVHYKELEDNKDSKYFFDGEWWMQDSLAAWHERFPYLGLTTIKKYFHELCQEGENGGGYLIKQLANQGNGRAPSFYRINPDKDLFLKVQKAKAEALENYPKAENPKVGIRPTPKSESDQPQSRNPTMASSILIKSSPISSHTSAPAPFGSTGASASACESDKPIPKSNHTDRTWSPGHPLESIFKEMTKLDIARLQFSELKYTEWLEGQMQKHGVSIIELAECAYNWQVHHNQAKKKVASSLSSFGTWVTKYADDRDRKRGWQGAAGGYAKKGSTFFPPPTQELYDSINNSVKINDFQSSDEEEDYVITNECPF